MASSGFNSVSPSISAIQSRNNSVNFLSDVNDVEKVTINVGGRRFETQQSTLKNVPDSLLAKLDASDHNYNPVLGEYFFDRNPCYFASILDYYRTGYLHFPHCYCGPAIKTELDFWGIDENCINECCWRSYKEYYDEKSTLDELNKTFSGMNSDDDVTAGEGQSWLARWRTKLWHFLDKPDSSKGAQIWSIIFFILILVSIAIVAMETHPNFRVKRKGFDLEDLVSSNRTINPKLILYYETVPHTGLQAVDGICVVIFTVELLLRFLVSPSKLVYIKSFFNIVDILCVLPLFITLIVHAVIGDFLLREQSIILIGYLSLTSVLRVFRLFKIARYYRSFRLLILAVKSSFRELFLLVLLITMGMLIFSTLIYFAEFQVDNKFRSIPIGFWWSIITMTTVGYGEITPQSGWGFLVGGICAVSGMLITGLPIPIIASNFNHYHTNARFADSLASKQASMSSWRGMTSGQQLFKRSATTRADVDCNTTKDSSNNNAKSDDDIKLTHIATPRATRRARSAFVQRCSSPRLHTSENRCSQDGSKKNIQNSVPTQSESKKNSWKAVPTIIRHSPSDSSLNSGENSTI